MASVDTQHPHRRPNNGAFLHYFRDLANASQYHQFTIRNSCDFPNDDEKTINFQSTIKNILFLNFNSKTNETHQL